MDNDHLFSLRLDDVLPLQRIRVRIQIFMHTHEYRAGLHHAVPAALASIGGGGGAASGKSTADGVTRGAQQREPWATCELDEFLDMVSESVNERASEASTKR